ncbi:MAG: helix-turn-helix domain-containing protein [Chloroflexota bacterium]
MTTRGDRTKARLLDAALTVVGEVGYARASTRAIADRAGVAEATIYRHFPDKTALLFAAALEPSADVVDWISGLPALAGTSTLESNLTAALLKLAELESRILPLEVALQADPLLSQRRRAVLEGAKDLPGPPGALASYLAAERELGRVAPAVDPVEAAVVLLAALFGLGMADGRATGAAGQGRVRAAVRMFVRGIAPRTYD